MGISSASGPDMTFTVHPRPASDHREVIADAVATATVAAVERAPAHVQNQPKRNTFLGSRFLVRYAFGQH